MRGLSSHRSDVLMTVQRIIVPTHERKNPFKNGMHGDTWRRVYKFFSLYVAVDTYIV